MKTFTVDSIDCCCFILSPLLHLLCNFSYSNLNRDRTCLYQIGLSDRQILSESGLYWHVKRSRPKGSRLIGSRPNGSRPNGSRPNGSRPNGKTPAEHPALSYLRVSSRYCFLPRYCVEAVLCDFTVDIQCSSQVVIRPNLCEASSKKTLAPGNLKPVD